MVKYVIFLVGARILAALPTGVAYRFGEWLADIAFLVRRRPRRAVMANLRHVMGPDIGRRQLWGTARRIFRNVAHYYVDMARTPHTRPSDILERKITHHGLDFLLQAAHSGRGVIITSAHFGNPEMALQAALALGIKVTVLTEPLNPPAMSRLLDSYRSSHGHTFLPVNLVNIKKVIHILRKGGAAAIMCDRDIQGRGIVVPFCGAETHMPTGVIELAMRTGAIVLPAFVYRRRGGQFEVFVEPPLEMVSAGYWQDDLRANLTQLLARFEAHLKRDPGQWVVLEPMWPSEQPHQPGKPVDTSAEGMKSAV